VIGSLRELGQMLADDLRVRYHRWRCDVHAAALAAAVDARKARIVRWTGRL
jgi:hypothetical protein